MVRIAESFIVEILSKPPKLYVLRHKDGHCLSGTLTFLFFNYVLQFVNSHASLSKANGYYHLTTSIFLIGRHKQMVGAPADQ